MSYDVGLRNPETKELAKVKNHSEGGTYALGGIEEASLNITYNYGWFYYRLLDKEEGLRWLYGKTGKECISRLEKVVEELGTKQYSRPKDGSTFNPNDRFGNYVKDYWAPTPGNAGYALNILLQWAKEHPGGVFEGD